jgi:hypothetical protein
LSFEELGHAWLKAFQCFRVSYISGSDGHNAMPKQANVDKNGETSVGEPLSLLIKEYIDQQIQNSKETDEPSKKKKWKNSWRSASPITKATFILASAVSIATVAYSIIAAFQLSEMKRTNSLTQQALNGSEDTLNKTLAKLQGQIDETHSLAGHAGDQATTAHSTLSVIQNQFRLDQRPYVLLAPTSRSGFDPSGHFFTDFFPVNYGKTPSIKGMTDRKMFIGDDAMHQADIWFRNFTKKLKETPLGAGSETLPQGIPGDQKGNWITITSAEPISQKSLSDIILSGNEKVVFVFSIRYTDSSSTPYRTDACFRLLTTGAMSQCPRHNDSY